MTKKYILQMYDFNSQKYLVKYSSVLDIIRGVMDVDECKLYVFHHCQEKFEKALNNQNIDFRKEPANSDNSWFLLSMKDYMFYVKNHDKYALYVDLYEDPEFFQGAKKKAEIISHEYLIRFFISNEKREEVERILQYKLTEEE